MMTFGSSGGGKKRKIDGGSLSDSGGGGNRHKGEGAGHDTGCHSPRTQVRMMLKSMQEDLENFEPSHWSDMDNMLKGMKEEDERMQTHARFAKWIRMFHVLVVEEGHYKSYSHLEQKLGKETFTLVPWECHEHVTLLGLLAKAPFKQFDITAADWDISTGLSREGGSEKITGQNVKAVFEADLTKLKATPSFIFSEDEKDTIQRIMRCVRYLIECMCK